MFTTLICKCGSRWRRHGQCLVGSIKCPACGRAMATRPLQGEVAGVLDARMPAGSGSNAAQSTDVNLRALADGDPIQAPEKRRAFQFFAANAAAQSPAPAAQPATPADTRFRCEQPTVRLAHRKCPACGTGTYGAACPTCGRAVGTTMSDILKAPFSAEVLGEAGALLVGIVWHTVLILAAFMFSAAMLSSNHDRIGAASLIVCALLIVRMSGWEFGVYLDVIRQFAAGAPIADSRTGFLSNLGDFAKNIIILATTYGVILIGGFAAYALIGGPRAHPQEAFAAILLGLLAGSVYGNIAVAVAAVDNSLNPLHVWRVLRQCWPVYIRVQLWSVPVIITLFMVIPAAWALALYLATAFKTLPLIAVIAILLILVFLPAFVLAYVPIAIAAMLGMVMRWHADGSRFRAGDSCVSALAIAAVTLCLLLQGMLVSAAIRKAAAWSPPKTHSTGVMASARTTLGGTGR